MFATILVGFLLSVLLGPSWLLLIRFRKLTAVQALQRARLAWIAMIVIAAALIFLADAIGLTNPLGYMLGICFALGTSGAVFLWWRSYGHR